MGIHDREYYRDGSRRSLWISSVAPACKAIVAINVVVYIAMILFDFSPLLYLEAKSALVFEKFQVWRLVTSAFVHDPNSIWHLLINMLMLWFVGREVEEIYGSREFVFMYLGAAVFSTLTWCLFDYFGPHRNAAGVIGASGAVLAVAVIFTMYYPTREIFFMFFVPMPMWLLLSIYVGSDLYYMLLKLKGMDLQRVAFASHLGGAAYGLLYKHFNFQWSRLALKAPRIRPARFRVYSGDPSEERQGSSRPGPAPGRPAPSGPSTATRPAPASAAGIREEELARRLDEILAKIAGGGKDQLTEEENRVLQVASERARDRRRGQV